MDRLNRQQTIQICAFVLKDRVVAVDGIQWDDISEGRQNELFSTKGHRLWKINSMEGTKVIGTLGGVL